MQTFTNNAYGFLASGVSAVATTLVLGSGEGARFPTTSGDNFKVTLIALTNGQETAWEIVNVTGRSSDTLTVTRAQEGTPALVWPSLTRVELRLTAGATESKANLGTAAYMTGPSGTLVGTTDTQTLTNKTLSGALEVVGASVPATLSAANGGIQKFTLTTNWAGSDALTAGSSVLVMVKTTASYSFTPPTTVWTGGTAPTLSTTLFNCIEFWKVGTTLYGAWLGTVAS